MSRSSWTSGDGPVIDVEGLEASADQPVFGPLDLEVGPGGTLVIVGPAGSGKTALLLTLTGRMHATGGSGTVLGADVRKDQAHIRSDSSVAWVDGITDLDKDYTVEQHVAERLIGLQPWYRPFVRRADVHQALDLAGFSDELPLRAFASELTQLQKFEAELLLARLDGSAIIALDNIDFLREPEDRKHAWSLLGRVQESVAQARPDRPLSIIVTCENDAGFAVPQGREDTVRVHLDEVQRPDPAPAPAPESRGGRH
ncbi:MAG: ATP-binding cassette domain-containing protein [Brevibacterium yomogidense]